MLAKEAANGSVARSPSPSESPPCSRCRRPHSRPAAFPALSATRRARCCRAPRSKPPVRRSSKRSAASSADEQGRYNITDLVPGTYAVTFRLHGFNTVRREGITLTSGFTATVNADLQVGSLEETITVSGASPIVDTSNVRRQTVASARAARRPCRSAQEHPVARHADPGLDRRRGRRRPLHGRGRRVPRQARHQGVVRRHGHRKQRRQQQLSDQLASVSGNGGADERHHGRSQRRRPGDEHHPARGRQQVQRHRQSALFTNYQLESSNLNDELRARGFTNVNKTYRMWDEGATIGGPIMQDRLWFLGAPRTWGFSRQIAGAYWNKTQDVFLTPPGAERKVVLWTPWVDRPLEGDSGR